MYGRAESDFKLNPIRLPFLQETLKLDANQTIEEYAVWGGVPRYCERDIPFGESAKTTKRSLYRIADPFLSFHFRFVAPMRSFIELECYAPVDAVTGNIIDT